MKRGEYSFRLALSWLNQSLARSYSPATSPDNSVWSMADQASGGASVVVRDLFDAGVEWDQRAQELASRLNDSRPGSYLLWVPPGGELPGPEPEESEWVRRVVLAASRLASGREGEARFPVKLTLGKLRDEGGHASVTGGLGRHWTDISEGLQGSFFLDSTNLKRLTVNEEERAALYQNVALLSQGLATGEVSEFEHDDAWTVQRLPRGAAAEGLTDGWVICGCPSGFAPEDGAVIRRLLRRRLNEAMELLAGRERPWLLVLLGAYDYMANENAGPSLRGFDPALSAAFDGVLLVADGAVKPLVLGPSLSRRNEGVAGGG